MNKRYMDFVPVKAVKKPEPAKLQVSKAVEVDELEINEMFEARNLKRKEPKYGVIEDFQPKFIKTEVKKRPLSAKRELESAKAKKISGVPKANKVAAEKVKEEKPVEEKPEKILKVPKSPFINSDKLPKRPLSKNVYQKKVIPQKEEEPSAPVTIINKPDKDSKVGLVVTIIITIVLGAAAGTVAFLLLPK